MRVLNDRQTKFAEAYAHSGNATQAAKKAGYSEKTAYKQGHDLLKKGEIQTLIAKEKAKQAKKNDVTVEEIVNMHLQAFECAQRTDAPNAMTSAGQNLAKLMGLVTERGQIEHSGGLTINIQKFNDDADS